MHGILQVRILEWVAFPSQGDLPNPETEPPGLPPALQSDSLQFEPPGKKSLLNGKIFKLCSRDIYCFEM